MKRTVEDIRALFQGPVNSIPTPFLEGGDVDFGGVRNIVEAGIDGGSTVTLLTYGDSRFDVLSEAEIAELTRTVIDAAAGRSVVVAANKRSLGTAATVAFAEFCRDAGADILMTLPGVSALGLPPESLAGYYKAVADVMPVMLVGAPEHAVLDLIVDVPNIIAFKEDGAESYAVKTMRRYHGRWEFMTGGQLWRHFTQWPFGCRAFMSPWCALDPGVNGRYWDALNANDLATAAEVVARIDAPMFDASADYTGGWQPFWHGMLELKGLAGRYMRAPEQGLPEADLDRIRADMQALGVAL